MKILLVEDDTRMADDTADGLTRQDHTVDVARTGRDGLDPQTSVVETRRSRLHAPLGRDSAPGSIHTIRHAGDVLRAAA